MYLPMHASLYYIHTLYRHCSCSPPFYIRVLHRFDDDKDAYFVRIRECVSLSVQFRLTVPQDENCPLIFSEPQPEHMQIVQKILYASEEDELRQQQQPQPDGDDKKEEQVQDVIQGAP